MFNFFKKKCHLCNNRAFRKQLRPYYDDAGNRVYVCRKCVYYAERRALRRI